MKTVVITGSARGLGFEMAKMFRKHSYQVVISDVNTDDLNVAKTTLKTISGTGRILACRCDITQEADLENLIETTVKEMGGIDIWINNAGINQPEKAIWELSKAEIERLVEVDLLGTIHASRLVSKFMIDQNKGALYNVEGHGSNDAIIKGLSIYGTTKRAVTYFTDALSKELEDTPVLVGKLSPGIMITDFVVNAFSNQKIELSDKNKKVYNILGDYPDIVAAFLVKKMITNTKRGVRIAWLTNRKAAWRFMTSSFNKRDFFT